MKIQWHHIPEQRDRGLPEQWQARLPGRSVAVLRLSVHGARYLCGPAEWQAVLCGPEPDGPIGSMMMTGSTHEQAKTEVEHSLHQMGWR